jgi:hypothetical protein
MRRRGIDCVALFHVLIYAHVKAVEMDSWAAMKKKLSRQLWLKEECVYGGVLFLNYALWCRGCPSPRCPISSCCLFVPEAGSVSGTRKGNPEFMSKDFWLLGFTDQPFLVLCSYFINWGMLIGWCGCLFCERLNLLLGGVNPETRISLLSGEHHQSREERLLLSPNPEFSFAFWIEVPES